MKLKHAFVSSKLNRGQLERRNYGEKLAAIPHDKYFMMIEQYSARLWSRNENLDGLVVSRGLLV